MAWLDPIHFYRPFGLPEPLTVGSVKWFQCAGEHVEGAECGYIVVPLDYADASAGVAKIALGRYNATTGPRKGMILMNPGGPGSPGVSLATQLGPYFHTLTGSDYDIVGFDPRGVGASDPRIKCFRKGTEYLLFRGNTVLETGLDVGTDFSDPLLRARLLEQWRAMDALTQAQYQTCERTMGEQIKYMGTTLVARDINFMTTALEGRDALINFYGGSYGSVLGQYVINMFPHSVGRIVIDAVADASGRMSLPIFQQQRHALTSTEDTFEAFLDACSQAGPTACPLSKATLEKPSDIGARIESFLESLYVHPLPVANAKRSNILTSGRARKFLFTALMHPRSWPSASTILASAIAGNAAPLLNTLLSGPGFSTDLESEAVWCNDLLPSPQPSDDAVVDEYLSVLRGISRFGLDHPAVASTECHHWPFSPPERFDGPWNQLLLNPILILSNTADPVTPLSAARSVSGTLPHSSRLVVQNSPGHGSTALASLCTARIMRSYFQSGSLPPPGTVCEVDESPFPGAARTPSTQDELELESLRTLGAGLDLLRSRAIAGLTAP